MMAAYLNISWSSPSIPLLTSPDSPIGVVLTKKEASWVVSVLALGMMPGSFSVNILLDSIGRKKTMLVSALLFFVSWILIIFAQSFTMLVLARIVGGFGIGVSVGVIPLYIGEISQKQHRGTLCSLPPLGSVLAPILAYTIGPFVSFTTLGIICAFVAVLFFATSYFIFESPYYLIKINQPQAAEDVLKYLSGTDNVDEWFEEIKTTIRNDGTCNLKLTDLLFKSNHLKSFMIIIALKTFQQFSGSVVIGAHIQTIMEESQTTLSAETSSIIFATIQIPCVIVSSYFVDKFGRRLLLMVSATGCALCLAGEGIYFYLMKRNDVDLTKVYFAPTLFLTLYYIMISFGVSNLPYVAAGELFSTTSKKLGGTVFAFYGGFLMFEEASWVISVLALGIIPGSVVVSLVVDRIGRKKALLGGAFLIFIPWVIIIFAQSLIMLLVARIVGGFGIGILNGVMPLYNGEISEKQHRGALCSLPSIGTVLAPILILYHWSTVVSYFIPESPHYLVKINQPEAAEETLKFLTGNGNVEQWLKEIETTIRNDGTSKFKLSQLLYERNHQKSFMIVIVLMAAASLYISWSSPSIPLLTSPNSPIDVVLTKEEASWVVSVLALGMMPGSIIVGFSVDSIGRKKTMQVGAVFVFLPWIIIIFTQSFIMLLVARILGGFGIGILRGVIPLYNGEISENQYRGTLCSLPTVGMVLAPILVYTIGPLVSYDTLAKICAVVPMIFLVTSYFIPESPYYLVKINQLQAAEKALNYLTGTTNTEEWLKEIESTIRNDGTSNLKLTELFYERNHQKAFMIVIALKTFQQFSGLVVIGAYIQTIMEESQTTFSAQTSSIIFSAIQIPCVFVSSYLIDRLGRRPLLIISASGSALSLVGEGIYFYLLQRNDVDLSNAYFVPTFFLTVYHIMISFGVINLPMVAAGELFSSRTKKLGGAVFAFYTGFLMFISNKIFNPIVESWGMHVPFWIFGGVCILEVLFGLFVLPETKGKTFEEIQQMLGRKPTSDQSDSNYTLVG
ncbi:hypothetical protein FQR65_LT05458 [Abscondita terminalis]|nr:hypothetical protein FQR65_LT05458 [Abscondita terminalis]